MLSLAVAAALLIGTSRPVLVVNHSPEAIFTLRVGVASEGRWSDDLLGFADVIDVSRGITVHLPVDPSACTSDVQATLRSGIVVVVPAVDLCTADQIDVKPN